MRDQDLTERPGRGWTPWAKGTGDHDIEKVWWAARCLHFPKLNSSAWFDGSELVGIALWGFRGEKWCMKLKPADWQPLPDKFRLERERAQQEALDRVRIAAEARMLAQIRATGKRQSSTTA
ncbi:MAG: hypothetical protein EOS81_10575 [Mesorhizobium sp.]|nr:MULTISPECIES: hypothetical protein [unclassified Mesorhizobium]RVC61789.1 hypothetical protein EN759_28680 [Mesorhizobium sp. M00.F.Ca.ET.038.03.1.1]AZO38646.1 hypothetical protein EJ072_32475 [Mesorhizobium sp. M2A.F.Ca.ET.046.03.2.1]RWB37610.1 MAG: hypothetical protein EOQ44_32775 [Mesorhizobium sp.]RWE18778.1 MAG: hypothetical protein EOS76_14800 [Mesorhizobium sp.]RWE99914.1 MAG: hypothetical protein EOS81_10575 [Mesorhizobium sp.]